LEEGRNDSFIDKNAKAHLDLKTDNNLINNPCLNDANLCRKNPNGNGSFICIKSFLTQDYTLCLPTRSMNCRQSNPCLNGGVCIVDNNDNNGRELSWRCMCNTNFTGRLCETEICSPMHRIFQQHTMCMPDSVSYISGGLNNDNITLILDLHNLIRSQVVPLAANMQKMYWDLR
jgi:hypothetical protein